MENSKKITLAFNIGFYFFQVAGIALAVGTDLLFNDVTKLEEVALIDKIFQFSFGIGMLFIIILSIGLLLVNAFFIREIWNRLELVS